MEFLIELVLDLLVDGGMEVISSKKVSKKIRIPILIFLVCLFTIIILGIILLGILLGQENLLIGLLFVVLVIVFLILFILKFKKIYLEKFKENEKGE